MRLRYRCALVAALTTLAFVTHSVQAQIDDPIIPGVSVEISDVVRLPDTRGMGQEDSRSGDNYARINFMHEIPGDPSKWLVNDLRGQIYRVDPATQRVETYLDVGDVFDDFIIGPGGLSTGLINVSPHPDFATNGKFYTIHEERASGNPATPDFEAVGDEGNIEDGQHGVVTEWTANDPAAGAFSGTHRELLRVAQPAGNLHNLGDIGFDPTLSPGDPGYGLMYIAGGDGGYDSENKGSDQAREDGSIFGKVLRIDPNGDDSANGAYGIPTDNAFAADGDPDSLGEVFAEGFRNAHRISWDLETGLLLTTDIGQGAIEEVNFLRNGEDYGWSDAEGTFSRGGGPSRPIDGVTYPAAQYDHGDGFAIAGGFVYRGDRIPALEGKFVYGDIVNGRLFYSDLDELIAADSDGVYDATADVYELFLTRQGEPVTLEDLIVETLAVDDLPNNRHDLRFGQTSDGEIYVMTKQDGVIRQLVGPRLDGDFNSDGVVDAADYVMWRDNLGAPEGTLANDPVGGEVGPSQYGAWRDNYGETTSTTPAPAPEPGSLAGAALGAMAIGLRRKRPITRVGAGDSAPLG